MSEAPARLFRGVFRAPYLVGGCPVLIAVDSRGEARMLVTLSSDVSLEYATASLHALLDRIDPAVRLA